MLKRIVQLFFVLIGGTLGFLFIPEVIEILNFGELPNWVMSSYAGAVFGAIIFYLSTFWLADYIVGLMKLMEEAIVKAPITDVLFGTMGLIVGLIVAYLIGIPIDAIQVPVISSVLPIFITFFLGYFGFQIGFKKRDELINLFSVAQRKDKKKDGDVEKERSGSMKLLDTSVIIDGRIADICKTGFLEGT